MADGGIEEATQAAHDGTVAEKLRDGCGVEGGRHDDELQLRTVLLQAAQQGQRKVAIQVTLVELVEYDGFYATQIGIADETTGEHAFGEEAQARLRAGDIFEAHLVTNGVADFFAHLEGHAAGGHAGGDAARFQHKHLTTEPCEQRGRHARGFAGAGRSLQHKAGVLLQAGLELRQNEIDRERRFADGHESIGTRRGVGVNGGWIT